MTVILTKILLTICIVLFCQRIVLGQITNVYTSKAPPDTNVLKRGFYEGDSGGNDKQSSSAAVANECEKGDDSSDTSSSESVVNIGVASAANPSVDDAFTNAQPSEWSDNNLHKSVGHDSGPLIPPDDGACLELDKTNAQVERVAHNAGLHRSLETLVWLSSSVLPLEDCQVLLQEHLPSGAYLDNDQINNMAARGQLPPSVVSGLSNVEAGEWDSRPSTALFFADKHKLDDKERKNTWLVNYTLPVHVRYHRARSSTTHGTEALVRITHPTVFVLCPELSDTCLPYTLPRPCSPAAQDPLHYQQSHHSQLQNHLHDDDDDSGSSSKLHYRHHNKQILPDVNHNHDPPPKHDQSIPSSPPKTPPPTTVNNKHKESSSEVYYSRTEEFHKVSSIPNVIHQQQNNHRSAAKKAKLNLPIEGGPSFGLNAPEPEPVPKSFRDLPSCYWLPIHSFSTTEGVTLQVPVGNTDNLELVLFVTTAVTTAAALLLLTPLLQNYKKQHQQQ